MKLIYSAALWAGLALSVSVAAHGAQTWTEGVNYFLVQPARPTSVAPGKVEVTEVFSYACPACNIFQPTVHKLKQSLPANAVLDYIPAAFNTAEDWPMFQLAYVTAQVLGVDQQTHDAMFDAVWKGGDLSITDPSTRALKSHMPTIEDAAPNFTTNAPACQSTNLSRPRKSFSVDLKVRTDQDLIMAYKVDRTPTHHRQRQVSIARRIGRRPGSSHRAGLKYLVAKESK